MAGANCSIERGCGTREEGGIYAEVGVGPNGTPLERCILDPPVLLNPDLGVSPVGVTLVPFQHEGGRIVHHIADWVGSNNYPNPWDILGEGRNFGFSRRLPSSLNFSLLCDLSRLLLIHAHGAILNAELYTGTDAARFGKWATGGDPMMVTAQTRPFGATWKPGKTLYGGWKCPKCLALHEPQHAPEPCCAGVWGQDIEQGEELPDEYREMFRRAGYAQAVDGVIYDPEDPRLVLRRMPSFSYVARRAPDNAEPLYAPAFIATLPLARLAVVAGHGDAGSLEKAGAARMTVNLVNE